MAEKIEIVPTMRHGMNVVYVGQPGELMAILPNNQGVLVAHPERQPKIVRPDGTEQPLHFANETR